MRVNQAKRLKVLETQNVRLKRIVADKELDIQIMSIHLGKEVRMKTPMVLSGNIFQRKGTLEQ